MYFLDRMPTERHLSGTGHGLIPSFSEAQLEKQAGEENDPKDKKKRGFI